MLYEEGHVCSGLDQTASVIGDVGDRGWVIRKARTSRAIQIGAFDLDSALINQSSMLMRID
jgi:hypothetical protein